MAGWPRTAWRAGKRAAPLVVELYRRWERMPEHEKERYRKMVQQYSERGRTVYGKALERRRKRRGR